MVQKLSDTIHLNSDRISYRIVAFLLRLCGDQGLSERILLRKSLIGVGGTSIAKYLAGSRSTRSPGLFQS